MTNDQLPAIIGNNDESSTTALTKRNAEVQAKMKEAEEGKANAFEAVKMMLDTMNESLEGANTYGAPPRYVRIAKVGENKETLTLEKRPVGIAVQEFARGFLYALGVVTELALKAHDLLRDIDGGKALVEVGAAMIETLASDEFTTSLQRAVGIEKPAENPMKRNVGPAVKKFKEVLNYVPGPDDVQGVSKALYNLLAVEHLSAPEGQVHVDLNGTGRARLMSWALERPIPIFFGSGLFDFSNHIEITYLGSRIIENPKDPKKAEKTVELNWKSEDQQREELIYKCDYPAIKKNDFDEIKEILNTLHYEKSTPKENLTDFQKINELKKDGGRDDGNLDLHTIHRLMNMDYKNHSLKRAKPFKA